MLRDRLGGRSAGAARAFARRLAVPFRMIRARAIATPERLWMAPPDIRTADATVAAEIRAGYFTFEGKTVHAPPPLSPFAARAPAPGWRRALTGFGWLRHLRDEDAAMAQRLVGDFLSRPRADEGDPATEPPVVARRLCAFLAQSPLLLAGAEPDFYEKFMQALAFETRTLWRMLASGEAQGTERALCAVALVQFAICADAGHAIAPQAMRLLADELGRAVPPDGGHVSRNPQASLDLLLDLAPLRQVFAARGMPTPEPLARAIAAMIPVLRMLQHGDGSLALFNGSGETAVDRLVNVYAHEEKRRAAPTPAAAGGYWRLEASPAVVLVDAGPPPPVEFSAAAHAGCLSFEYSIGAARVVVNCGAPGPLLADARSAARETAAHSTLGLGARSSARFADGKVVTGPSVVTADRRATDAATELTLEHDGYAGAFGMIHARELSLADDGETLAGRDRLLAVAGAAVATGQSFVVRFHLHPRVQAARVDAGVELTLATGEQLLFAAEGAPLALADSVFYATPAGARPCRQITLVGVAAPGAEVRWSFRRLRAADPVSSGGDV